MSTFSRLTYALGRVPLLRNALRAIAGWYPEGSVTRIRSGPAAGMLWKRHHVYVNGYWLGIYERDIQAALVQRLRPGQIFYDIGANAGFFSLVAANLVGSTGQVFAFEPLPENAAVAAEQIAVNHLANVHLVSSAVGATSGEAVLSRWNNPSTARLIAGEKDANSLRVPLVSLDDFVAGHPPPDLLKVDVEGAEDQVLAGARSLIARHAPAFLIELHSLALARGAFELLGGLGYRFSDLQGKAIASPDAFDDSQGMMHILADPEHSDATARLPSGTA